MTPSERALDATGRIRDSYEALPYQGGPHYGSHPDCLATVATLLGLRPADVRRCRVLELGCATGGNVIPMAVALPGSTFVGVDLAPGQIAEGTRVVEALGLSNVRLLAADLRDVGPELGRFDYVLCHGVFSWVPREVRRRILDLIAEVLAPDGVAMVSFNTYPGSQPRDSVRGLFRFALDHVLAPGDPVEGARSLLRLLPAGFEGVSGAFVEQLRTTARECADEPAYYLGHEYLAEVNRPFFLWEFADAAEEAGLRWLGDAWIHDEGRDLPEGALALVEKLSPTRLAREQWLDFLSDRAFRRALLGHGAVQARDTLDPGRVMGLRASAGAWPDAPEGRREEGEPAAPPSFSSRTHRVSTNIPIVTAALRLLWEAWPESVAAPSLWQAARAEAGAEGAPADAPDDEAFFAGALLECYRRHVVGLHVHRFPVERRPGARPTASPLARHQAERGGSVTSLVHQQIALDPFDRSVLRLLDGSLDREGVLRAMAGEGGVDAERVGRSFELLGRAGLLVDGRGGAPADAPAPDPSP